MTIRPACVDDAEAILRLHREAILAKAAGHYDEFTLAGWAIGATPRRVARQQQQIADPQQ